MTWAASSQNQQNGMCAQRRLTSAWTSAQSDQSLRCPHEESLSPWLPIERTTKTLIRLSGCPGWSESSLGSQSFGWFCHEAAHIIRFSRRRVFKVFTVYGHDHHSYKLSFHPAITWAPNEIWLRSTQSIQRCLKMLTDGRMTTNGRQQTTNACIYYNLTFEPSKAQMS